MDFVLDIVIQLIGLYRIIIIIHILLSWFPQIRQTGFGRFIGMLAEPYLEPFRRIIPTVGMFDFSPIVAFIALNFAIDGIRQIQSFF
ncbi:YggT family protein [Gottfriedia sp. NPDC056225]|uniref:YggT family protein n=1 Tax=Gottfriedia sp. NPDC056225 TaxID=3345751 RepID=UPI001558DFDA|nr:YggT family protein [Arthrobacter citreus]